MRNGTVDDEPAVLPEGEELRKLGPGEEFDPLKALDSRELLGRGHHGRSDAMSLQVRVNRDPRERRDAIHTWQDDDHTRRTAADLGEYSAATPQAGGQASPRSRSMAVEGGSTGGRAPKALWMTSTIAAASCGDAIETTRSETETLTSREA